MKSIKMTYRIEKKDEKQYYFMPFDVPEGVESMEISYSYTGDNVNSRVSNEEKNVIDIGLRDEKGDDIGTRGSNVRNFKISPNSSTTGFKNKEIKAGIWQMIIGAYQIRNEGVTVNFDIMFNMKAFRWLKGDTHIHTNHSDGKYSRREIAGKARKRALDFIILTDHNNNLDGIAMPEMTDLTIIKGIELTNYKGHMNIFGTEKPYDGSFAINNINELLEHNRQAKERGALQVLNHPFCSLCPWLMGFSEVHYDAIEVWNGPMRKDNLKAVEWWNGQLKNGKRLPIIGGSDYHRDYFVSDLFARPTLFVYADCNSMDSILKAIADGRCFITSSPKATTVEMWSNGKGMGEEIEFSQDAQINIKVVNMKKKHKLKVIDNDGISFEFVATKKGNYDFEVSVRQKGFVRCEIEYQKKGLSKIIHKIALYFLLRKEAYEKVPPFIYTITNPIYIK